MGQFEKGMILGMKKIHWKKIDIKQMLKNIKGNLVVDRLNAIEWIVLSVVLLLITITFFYEDNIGMFLSYFWINNGLFNSGSVSFLGNNQLTYGIVQQLFCELWTLPLNILHILFRISPDCIGAVIWYKLSMSFAMALCMREMIRLGTTLNISKERIKWMLILMLSTVLVALPVFHIAQTDILYAFLMIAGIHALIKEDRKRFILYFALAVSCKVIAAIVFIPLVLLNEKRILFVIRDAILGVMIFPLERGWYKVVEKANTLITGGSVGTTRMVETVVEENTVTVEKTMDQINTDFFSHFYHKALYFEIPAIRKGYVASLMVVLLVGLCIWCYVQSKEKNAIWKEKCIFGASAAWMIFFTCASPSPYWIVAMYPFWFVMIFMKPDRIRSNMLLMNAFTFSMFIVYLVNAFWVYGGSSNLNYLILKGLLPEGHDSTTEGPYVARYLFNMGIESVMNIVVAICLAVSIGLVVVNYHKVKIDEELTEYEERKLMHGFAIFQIAFLCLWYILDIYAVTRW